MIAFERFFFGLFPSYYKREDSNKDVNGEGTLERYINTFGIEIDEAVIPKIEDLVANVMDAVNCDAKFLNHIAYTLGNPPDVMNSEELYRKLLLNIVSIYKIKGTIPSYWYFFNLLGFRVWITEFDCVDHLYDAGFLYDEDPNIKYDTYCCTCSEYTIGFSAATDSCVTNTYSPLSQTALANLLKVIFFLEPINAKLRNLDYLIKFCDVFDYCYHDLLTWETRIYRQYDNGLLYDDAALYDEYDQYETDAIAEDSCSPNSPNGPFLLQENLAKLLQENSGKIIIT